MTTCLTNPPIDCRVFPEILELSVEALENDSMLVNNVMQLRITLPGHREGEMLFITFPWGETASDFTNKEWGQAIRASTASEWKLNEAENEEWGKYWVLEAKGKGAKPLTVQFEHINILTEGISCVRVLRGDRDSPVLLWEAPVLKEMQRLRIESFTAKHRTIPQGDPVELSWCALGSDYCMLDPGNIMVPQAGEKKVYTEESRIYTLRAVKDGRAVSKQLRVYIRRKENG